MLSHAGGALIWCNNINVDPHTAYTISIGRGGNGMTEAGGPSMFASNEWRCVAHGGAPGAHHVGGQGGSWGVEGPSASTLTWVGGGNGGRGADASWNNHVSEDVAGGGGGAGGYTGECIWPATCTDMRVVACWVLLCPPYAVATAGSRAAAAPASLLSCRVLKQPYCGQQCTAHVCLTGLLTKWCTAAAAAVVLLLHKRRHSQDAKPHCSC